MEPGLDATPFSVMCIDDNVLLIDALERRFDIEPGFTGFQRADDLATVGRPVVEPCSRPSSCLTWISRAAWMP